MLLSKATYFNSYTDGSGCHERWWPAHQEQHGVQNLALGHSLWPGELNKLLALPLRHSHPNIDPTFLWCNKEVIVDLLTHSNRSSVHLGTEKQTFDMTHIADSQHVGVLTHQAHTEEQRRSFGTIFLNPPGKQSDSLATKSSTKFTH